MSHKPTVTRTEAEEAAFMADLIQGLDDDFWTAGPSPDVSPVKGTMSGKRSKGFGASTSTSALRIELDNRLGSVTGTASMLRTPKKIKFNAKHVPSATSTSASYRNMPTLGSSSTSLSSTSIDLDMSAFLQGSEFWDLGDDIPSPVKPVVKLEKLTAIPNAPHANGDKKPIRQPGFTNIGFQDKVPHIRQTSGMRIGMPTGTTVPTITETPIHIRTTSEYTPDPCTRCVVLVVENEFVENSEGQGQFGRKGWQKRIQAQITQTKELVEVILCDDWYQTDIRVDDIFNVLGHFNSTSSSTDTTFDKRSIILTSTHNLLILHPDILLTATALSTASTCTRKPLLTGMVRQSGDITRALVVGNVLHEVFGAFLERGGVQPEGVGKTQGKGERERDEWMVKTIKSALNTQLGDLVKLGLGMEEVEREVWEGVKGFEIFAGKYLDLRGDGSQDVAPRLKESGTLTNTRAPSHSAPSRLAITHLLDVEEDIWSPRYGIKGKVDVSVRGVIEDYVDVPRSSSSRGGGTAPQNGHAHPHGHGHHPDRNGVYNSGLSAYTATPNTHSIASHFASKHATPTRIQTHAPLPLELKTGRAQAGMDHRAQTMLYTLLMSERYGVDVQDGLLFYSKVRGVDEGAGAGTGGVKGKEDNARGKDRVIGEDIVRVPRGRNEVRGLIGVRNELAGYMWRRIRKEKSKSFFPDKDEDNGVDENEDEDTEPSILADADVDMVDIEDIEDARSFRPQSSLVAAKDVDADFDEDEDKNEEHFLPVPIDDERTCKRCYAVETCMLFRKTHPHYQPSSSASANTSLVNPTSKRKQRTELLPPPGLLPLFTAHMAHLTPTRIAFFRKWEKLLSLEERDMVRFKRELWVLGAEEREKKGRCLAGMQVVGFGKGGDIEAENGGEWSKESKIYRFVYTFEKNIGNVSGSGHHPTSNTTLTTHLSKGDPITISLTSPREVLALARGFILDIYHGVNAGSSGSGSSAANGNGTSGRVVVGVDHSLDAWLGVGAGTGGWAVPFRGVRPPSTPTLTSTHASTPINTPTTTLMPVPVPTFRIDKDELFGGMSRVRENLAMLFYPSGRVNVSSANGSGSVVKMGRGDKKRLELIVDLRKPVFRAEEGMEVVEKSVNESTRSTTKTSNETQTLNASQRTVISNILRAEDYALVLGMPGTGKTSLIAELIRVLAKRGKTVLVSAYTHSAVDSILRKVGERGGGEEEEKFGILRLGNVEKVHPQVQKYCPSLISSYTGATETKESSLAKLQELYMTAPVVATTCLGLDHPLFARRPAFDYCIIDEASQITLPTCLGPLRFADVFILVGDHFQLGPLVKNPTALSSGLDMSLFRLLANAHPESVMRLRVQYRMNQEIMGIANALVYGREGGGENRGEQSTQRVSDVADIAGSGEEGSREEGRTTIEGKYHDGDRDGAGEEGIGMICGTEDVACRGLGVETGPGSFMERLHAFNGCGDASARCKGGEGCWLENVCNERTKAVFINTDNSPNARETRVAGTHPSHKNTHANPIETLNNASRKREGLVQNIFEATLVRQLVDTLCGSGIQEERVGVISLYRQQVKVLGEVVHRGGGGVGNRDQWQGGEARKGVEVMTVDQSQGRDKDCVIVSLVRSNDQGDVGDLLKDWRRINVAFTRARAKLIIIGSRRTLEKEPLLKRFFDFMDCRKWVLDLQEGVEAGHCWGHEVDAVPAKDRKTGPRPVKRRRESGGDGHRGDEEDMPTDKCCHSQKQERKERQQIKRIRVELELGLEDKSADAASNVSP